MEKSKINRINELAKKAREGELTSEEATERQHLRAEYVAAMRADLTATLENSYIVDEKGQKKKVRRKDTPTRS